MLPIDKLFINGRIYTMEEEGKTVEAIGVKDGKIVFTGTNEEAAPIESLKKIDLDGKVVLPGFTDSHCHMAEVAEGFGKVNLENAASIEEVIALLKEKLPEIKPGQWLIGYQISSANLKENRLPDRKDLDLVSTEVPVFISSNCLHNYMTNSKGLRLAGIDKNFRAPEIALMDCYEDGEPTGIFREHGMLKYINKVKPCPLQKEEEREEALYKGLMMYSAWGYTTLHTYDGFDKSPVDEISIYQKLEKKGRLPMRMIINRQHGVNNSLGAISGLGNEKVKYGAVKFFTDGNFAERSALLLKDYGDTPDYKGRVLHDFEVFGKEIEEAYKKGNDIAIHVIGDGGMEQVLNIIERIYDKNSKAQFRLIHATLVTEEQVKRLSKLPVIIDTQTIFMPSMGHTVARRLNYDERTKNVMAVKTLNDNGIRVTLSDDGPIATGNPFMAIRFATTREPSFGEASFQPQECLTVYDAVKMYTKNSAYDAHEEDLKGTITVGKLADFITISRDIFLTPPKEIDTITVLDTYLGGEKVE